MKYLYAAIMLASLVATLLTALLGAAWVFEGHGLHPAIAALIATLCLFAGWFAATEIDFSE